MSNITITLDADFALEVKDTIDNIILDENVELETLYNLSPICKQINDGLKELKRCRNV